MKSFNLVNSFRRQFELSQHFARTVTSTKAYVAVSVSEQYAFRQQQFMLLRSLNCTPESLFRVLHRFSIELLQYRWLNDGQSKKKKKKVSKPIQHTQNLGPTLPKVQLDSIHSAVQI